MELDCFHLRLPLAHPFTIARGTIESQGSLVLRLRHDGIVGWGEVTENDYYGHSFGSMLRSLERVGDRLSEYVSASPQDLWISMLERMSGDRFALSALDMAAHDWHARRAGVALWQHWGLAWPQGVPSSFTIGIDSIENMIGKLSEQPGWPIYKIKLGTLQDLEIVRALRSHTDAIFRVDANCGWSAQQTIENAVPLKQLGVQFIEQPLPTTASSSDKFKVFKHSVLPIIADEDCQIPEDVQRCREFYHGVNIKICKCGGLTPGLQMLREAKALQMLTMVGCMVETSVGISAAAQLLPLLDFADLDGAELLQDQPATGVRVRCGHVPMPELPGTGAELQIPRLGAFQIN